MIGSELLLDDIAEKYAHIASFMYTEYPHKSFWSKEFSINDIKSSYKDLAETNNRTPMLLYVHIPFCLYQCYYCTCHSTVTRDYSRLHSYMNMLYKEIELLKNLFDSFDFKPTITDIHIGGGTPTILNFDDFNLLIENIQKIVNLDETEEFSIEIDPRDATYEKMEFYKEKGINRISLGVQDFDINVQKAINRIQPLDMVESLMTDEIRSWFPKGVNFDIICGLPNQTLDTIEATFNEIVRLSPERICYNYLHYSPEYAPYQKIMFDGKNGHPSRLPNFKEKKQLFQKAHDILLENGYVRMGYDHFAKKHDELYTAKLDEKMNWNSLGVTVGRYTDVLAIGLYSYSTVGRHYTQNHFEMKEYEESLKNGKLPIYRGHHLDDDDVLRRDVIVGLRNFFICEIPSIEQEYNIDFDQYFSDELKKLNEFEQDGLVKIKNDTIKITENGELFANLVCRCFDKYYKET